MQLRPGPHLKVSGFHAELVPMQIAESRQRTRQVVQVVGGESQCICHFLGMGFNLARAWPQVQVWEVGFGGRESRKGPVGRGPEGWAHPDWEV